MTAATASRSGASGRIVKAETLTGVAHRLCLLWLATATVLSLAALPSLFSQGNYALVDYDFLAEDLPVLAALSAFAAMGLLLPVTRAAAAPGPYGESLFLRRPKATLAALAGASLLIAWMGARFTLLGLALSPDEFMARFDAEIFRHGEIMASVPTTWRPFAAALQPMFMTIAPSGAKWSSSYLPLNAAILALAGGAAPWVNPAWAAVSVLAVYGSARELWPKSPQAALLAAALLASSDQFLLMSASSYANPAHLALNLVWLWLFVRGGWLRDAAALGVGFTACGLHQLAFHPLFVAPFILELWLERRWRRAGIFTLGYAAICLFWVIYWSLAAKIEGLAAPAMAMQSAGGFFAHAVTLISAFDLGSFGIMAKNLVRFIAWQNPLAISLALVGIPLAWRARGMARALAAGIPLMVASMLLVLPYQGYGWGYRYLHGVLGSVCLLGGLGATSLIEGLGSNEKRRVLTVFVTVSAASLLVLTPVRLWQAARWFGPYERAHQAIAAAPAKVVLVDEDEITFGRHLVRNDPFLSNSPLVFDLESLTAPQVRDLCGRYSVSLFDRAVAARLGLPPRDAPATWREGLLKQLHCGVSTLGPR